MGSSKEGKRGKSQMNNSPGEKDTIRIGSQQEMSEMPRKYTASLIIKKGRKKGAEYRITGSRTVIGREAGADIIIDDPAVSRLHSAIEFIQSKFVLKDLDSTNGTLVGGKSINQAELSHGDLFQIGETVIEFVLTERSGESVYVLE